MPLAGSPTTTDTYIKSFQGAETKAASFLERVQEQGNIVLLKKSGTQNGITQ